MATSTVSSSTPSSTSLLAPTQAPTSSCANQVLIQLSTTLLVPDYSRYYSDSPIDLFKPVYFPLDDGSLITRPFIDDILHKDICILLTGLLAMLFARNILTSADYLRRVTLKDKSLFHVLFASQLLAVVAFIPTIISQFSQSPNCSL